MPPEPTSPHSPTVRKPPQWIWGVLIAAFVVWALINLQWGRAVGWDEVEFLKATDWIRQGQVPYRDFFEHHTPLTWFLMAPFEGLSRAPGVAPVLWMRWLQVPLWGVALWRMNAWMKEDGVTPVSRWFALGCLLGTPFFVFSALEYRIDTLGTLLVILALDRLRRPGIHQACAAGILLSASVLANLRFAPMAVALALAAASLDLEARRWRLQLKRLAALAGGGALALVPWALYLAATHSAGDFWHWCIQANQAASAAVGASRTLGTYLLYPAINWDLPGVLLEGGMVWGGWLVLKRFRNPGFMHLLLLAQIANLAFVAAMKVQYLYHFELVFCLAVPFTAEALDQVSRWEPRTPGLAWAAPSALSLAVLVNGSTLASAHDHATLRYQDQVLKQAAKLAPPGSTVLDGCGWLLESKPAYQFWFLPLLARVLCLQGRAAPYTPEDMKADPPALVIANARLENMALEHPETGLWLVTHYLPTGPNLWVPGLSRTLTASAPRWTWTVLADGDYRILAHPGLARHPWFFAPFAVTRPVLNPSSDLMVDPSAFQDAGDDQIRWSLDGAPVEPSQETLHLSRGQSLQAEFEGAGAIGVMLVPKGTGRLFTPPPPGLSLDYITFNSYWPRP